MAEGKVGEGEGRKGGRVRNGWFCTHQVGSGDRWSRWKGAAHSWEHKPWAGSEWRTELSPIHTKQVSAQRWMHRELAQSQSYGEWAQLCHSAGRKRSCTLKSLGVWPSRQANLHFFPEVSTGNIKCEMGKFGCVDSENLTKRTCVVTGQKPKKCSEVRGWFPFSTASNKTTGSGAWAPLP